MIKINRLIDEYHWDELSYLVEKFMSEAEVLEFYVFSDEYVSELNIVKELIDQMIFMQLSGDQNFTEFKFAQDYRRKRTKGVNSKLSKKRIISISKKINLKNMKRKLEEHLSNFFDSIPIDAWIKEDDLLSIQTNHIKNLNEYWLLFGHISKLSKFKETHEEER